MNFSVLNRAIAIAGTTSIAILAASTSIAYATPALPIDDGVDHGPGTPTILDGHQGDFYIDDSTNEIWGPKTSSGWPGSSIVALSLGDFLYLNAGPNSFQTYDGNLTITGGLSVQNANVVTANDYDTKGDILVSDASSGVGYQAVPVGSNSTVLTADSTQAAGVRWGVAAGTEAGFADSGSSTTNITSTSATYASAPTVATITVTGNGSNPLELSAYGLTANSVAAGGTGFRIYDATSTPVQLQDGLLSLGTAGNTYMTAPQVRVAAFSGTRTYVLKLAANGGTGTLYVNPVNRWQFSAVWR